MADSGIVLSNVVVVVWDGVAPFELGVLCETFGMDRSGHDLPNFDFAVVTPRPGVVRTTSGFDLVVQQGLERAEAADLVCVPAVDGEGTDMPAGVAAMLRATVERGARVLSVCSGAFALAEAGLLDGRACTTHWLYTDDLAARYPEAHVQPDVLYVEDGLVTTSAGTAAGIDACLHIVREELGAQVAAAFARRMVVPPHREGGQAQFVETPLRAEPGSSLEPLLEWMVSHLDEEMTVQTLARRAMLSPRTFARRFRAETGTTPYDWLLAQRVHHAQRLLEESDAPLDVVAERCGFGGAAVLRHHFRERLATTPQAYRRAFRRQPA